MKRYSVPFVLLAWLMFAGWASAEHEAEVERRWEAWKMK